MKENKNSEAKVLLKPAFPSKTSEISFIHSREEFHNYTLEKLFLCCVPDVTQLNPSYTESVEHHLLLPRRRT